jgi:hypothetical protein
MKTTVLTPEHERQQVDDKTPIYHTIRSSWKLDAKSEDTDRYFFHVEEVEAIQSGERAYVVGRKGTGKSGRYER